MSFSFKLCWLIIFFFDLCADINILFTIYFDLFEKKIIFFCSLFFRAEKSLGTEDEMEVMRFWWLVKKIELWLVISANLFHFIKKI